MVFLFGNAESVVVGLRGFIYPLRASYLYFYRNSATFFSLHAMIAITTDAILTEVFSAFDPILSKFISLSSIWNISRNNEIEISFTLLIVLLFTKIHTGFTPKNIFTLNTQDDCLKLKEWIQNSFDTGKFSILLFVCRWSEDFFLCLKLSTEWIFSYKITPSLNLLNVCAKSIYFSFYKSHD